MRNAFVIDLNRCSGCDSCTAICKYENNVGLGVYRCTVDKVGTIGEWPHPKQYWLPRQCQQCENAPCEQVCPTGATYRDEQFGIVVVNQEACIGCKLCMDACTFDARWFDEDNSVVEKCTGCIQRLEEGKKPICVKNCCCGARFFGDLDDPDSDAAKALAAADPSDLHQFDDPTGAMPSTVYILSERIAPWQDPATALRAR